MLRVTILYGLYTFVTVLDPGRNIGTLSDSRHTTLALCTIRHQYRAGHYLPGIDELLETRTTTYVATHARSVLGKTGVCVYSRHRVVVHERPHGYPPIARSQYPRHRRFVPAFERSIHIAAHHIPLAHVSRTVSCDAYRTNVSSGKNHVLVTTTHNNAQQRTTTHKEKKENPI